MSKKEKKDKINPDTAEQNVDENSVPADETADADTGADTVDEVTEEAAAPETEPADEGPSLEEEIKKLQDQLNEANDRILRSAAEFDNFRKRTEKEKSSAVSLGVGSAIEKILPALDTLAMAAQAESKDEDYKKGVLLTVGLFENALKALGVEEIQAEGQQFDPKYHNAVSRESGDYESGTVVRVLQKGYKMGDRIIRHAIVSVAE